MTDPIGDPIDDPEAVDPDPVGEPTAAAPAELPRTWWDKINPPIWARQWAYGIAAAALALAGTYGLIEGDQRAALELLAAALFGMARVNTPGKN